MTDIFDTLDVNGDGTITQDEIITFFRGDERAISEVKNLLAQGDSNNDQEYTREEFQQIIVNWKKKGLLKDHIINHLVSLEQTLRKQEDQN